MSTEVEQRNTQPNENTNMHPTNSQVGGPGALSSGPAQNGNQGRSDNAYAKAQGGQPDQEQPQQQNVPPPPTHPDRADQNGQYGQTQDQQVPGAGVGRDQHDQFERQDQNQPPRQGIAGGEHHLGGAARAAETGGAYEGGKMAHEGKRDVQYGQGTGPTSTLFAEQDQHHQHTLDRRGDRSPGAKAARATEAGAAYEGGKLASGGNHPDATDTQYQQGTGVGPGQHGQYASQTQGISGGDYDAGGHARAAGAGAAYEGSRLAHGTGGQQARQAAGHQAGTGAYDATGNLAGTARPAGQAATGAEAGTTAAAGGAAGPAHPGAGTYAGQQPAYVGQQTAGPGTGTSGTGTDTGFRGIGLASGQANVLLGKLQQAGGAILSDDAMKAKGLERESKGVAKVDQHEAQRLEGMANTRREKAGGVHAGGGPATANAGVDPTAGAHGRNL